MLDIIRLAVVLTVVALVAGLAIAFTNAQTEEKIEEQKQRAQQSALEMVLPEKAKVIEKTAKPPQPSKYWIAIKDNDTIAYAFQGASRGYSSTIRYIVGVRPDGEIVGLKILGQEETPGLGTRIEESVSTKYIWNGLWGNKEKTSPWFTEQFIGLDATEDITIDKSSEWHKMNKQQRQALKEQNQITAITGATISTEAVSEGVEKTISQYLPAVTNSQGAQ